MKDGKLAADLVNLVPNGNFAAGRIGGLPDGWERQARSPANAPLFQRVKENGAPCLLAAGAGSDDCFGYVRAPVVLKAGQTYRLAVRFQPGANLNPQLNLRFSFYADVESAFNWGIFRFQRLKDGWVYGEETFLARGKGEISGEVRIGFAFSAKGRARIREISLTECPPIAPRPVRVAATQGKLGLADWSKVLDAAGVEGADLVLLPETINGQALEPLREPTAALLAGKARRHRMYVAGGLYLRDRKRGRVFNACLLFDRDGQLVGRYDKNHLYTPELWSPASPSPGRAIPVFKTDFGTVGILICYDSWFPDVAELLALKGAEIILFPNAGYFRGLMPARAADNCVRFVVSSLHNSPGIWDSAGRDVTNPEADPTNCAGVPPQATARFVGTKQVRKARMVFATLDLSQSPSPHNWGGPCLSAPGGRRNRREQVRLLYDEIKREVERWWDDDRE